MSQLTSHHVTVIIYHITIDEWVTVSLCLNLTSPRVIMSLLFHNWWVTMSLCHNLTSPHVSSCHCLLCHNWWVTMSLCPSLMYHHSSVTMSWNDMSPLCRRVLAPDVTWIPAAWPQPLEVVLGSGPVKLAFSGHCVQQHLIHVMGHVTRVTANNDSDHHPSVTVDTYTYVGQTAISQHYVFCYCQTICETYFKS